jgi:hypothetical protein
MTVDRPTLAQLRARVHKDRHREIGNVLARRWARPAAVYGTWLALRLGLSAHQVTAASLFAALAGAAAIGGGTPWGFVAGVALLYVAFWLDHVDGQVARWRGTAGLDGVYLDYLMHHASNVALGFALGHGLALRTGEPRWSVAGFLIAAGWEGLGLHNDCRYKAFFQRLKRETKSYRVDGGSGGRPSPPTPWPGRWPGIVSWPLAKACEPHVVLFAISTLAVLALVAPAAWERAWALGVGVMAFVAPSLALARVGRTVARGGTEDEFRLWFREQG